MKLARSKALILPFLLGTASLLNGCGGAANIVIPESLKTPCESSIDVSGAQTVGDLGRAIVQGDADLKICSLKKDAITEIAESQNRRWYWPF